MRSSGVPRWIGVAVVLTMGFATVHAERRAPSTAERAVLNHYRDTIREVLKQFADGNWAESVDYEIGDDVMVDTSAPGPLAITDLIQSSYKIKPDSALYARDIAPVARQLASMTDPTAMARLASQMKVDHFTVQVHFNVINAGVSPAPPGTPDLHAAGAAYAYRIDNYMFDKGTSVVLMFGDWKSATWRAGDGAYRFKFKNAGHAAAIENIVVQMDGSSERINELVRATPWQRVSEGLTK
jgi:hypothetical protein